MLIGYFPVLVFATGVKLHAQTYIGLIIAQSLLLMINK